MDKYYEFIMILVEEKYDCYDGKSNQVFCERQECLSSLSSNFSATVFILY